MYGIGKILKRALKKPQWQCRYIIYWLRTVNILFTCERSQETFGFCSFFYEYFLDLERLCWDSCTVISSLVVKTLLVIKILLSYLFTCPRLLNGSLKVVRTFSCASCRKNSQLYRIIYDPSPKKHIIFRNLAL